MKRYSKRLLVTGLLSLSLIPLAPNKSLAQVVISSNYTQDFNGLTNSIPTGWSTYTAVTSNSLGTVLAFTNTSPTLTVNSWSNTTGAFKNLASSTGLSQTSSIASQQSSIDRALGIRPTGTFGDATTNFASINFNFNTTGSQVTSLSLDAMVLATETRTKLWNIQYGIGASPTNWTTLASFTSSTNWITTSFAFTPTEFGTDLDNQANLWFRFASTSLSTGSGSRPTIGIDNFQLQVIPEPSTLGLLTLGSLLGLSLRLKLKKNSKTV